MAEETPWQQALRYANRANPYPFYDELRKTPVARQPDGIYVVSTYRELVAAAPRPPGQLGCQEAPRGAVAAEGRAPSTAYDRAEHHHATRPSTIVDRRRMMRHFGPPDAPHMIADMEPEIRRIVTGLLDDMQGKTRIDVVDEFAYPGAGDRDLQGPGRAAGGRTRASTAGSRQPWTGWTSARRRATRSSSAAQRRVPPSVAEFKQFLAELIDQYRKQPGPGMFSEMVQRRRPGGAHVPRSRSSATRCSCSSPGMRPRST